jgi:adenosylcobinamide kinase/adenosylcobinamide-phosphate guanylyltransferase
LKEIVFVTGGCRSGKSTYAMQAAEKIPAEQKIYIATCVPRDDEMKRRVARHQKERSQDWVTVDAPLELPKAILQNSRRANVILVDCLTLWMSNLLIETGDENKIEKTISQLIDAIEKAECPIILVSNEVGSGIVPQNRLARQFRDMAGWLNQAVARCANKVVWMVAGIPVTVKSVNRGQRTDNR